MCKFFSVTSNGLGDIKYFNWEQRKEILRTKLDYTPDSHTSINYYYGFKGLQEDCRNKYEFNPITGEFTVDSINTIDDSTIVEEKVKKLDFKTIVEPLIIKQIVNPLSVNNDSLVINDKHIMLLREWDSVKTSIRGSAGNSVRCSVFDYVANSVLNSIGDSVWNSVRNPVGNSVRDSVVDSVGDSVANSVWNSIRNSVANSVWNSIGNSVWNSIGNSVRDSVAASVRDSVRDSIYAYTSSFFHLEKWNYIEHEPFINPFQSSIDLWEMGIIPSFDGETWRLHCDKDARVVFQISEEDLQAWRLIK